MREKELRIALVCFGGVSLAVYMHGVSKEILKLVRASRTLRRTADRDARLKATYQEDFAPLMAEADTEHVYFDLLREIGREIDLRVIVDIVAGASAGGINGTMLARALTHDLPIAPLRDLWLDNADVNVLLAEDARASAFSKLALRPLVWGAAATGFLPSIKDREVRRNLSLFVRSRWFKPPLDGPCMSRLMYDGITAMGENPAAAASLLPQGQRLDLFVTLTDYHGQLHLVQIHDPPVVVEREHRHVIHFQYRRNQSGTVQSDFGLENAAGLAFAARATSSFPGVFPPARIAEMDQLLAARGISWPGRAAFIEANFAHHVRNRIDPTYSSFIDGAVLNNRPFREAIGAIHGRPAYRQTERRLVYIEPHPSKPSIEGFRAIPGFFSTLRGALSDLPRSQPVTDELGWVINFNTHIRELRGIIDGARPQVTRLVDSIVEAPADWEGATQQITDWREEVNAAVAREAGFAYQGYVRLKLSSILRFVSQTIARIHGVAEQSPMANAIAIAIDAWAARNGIVYGSTDPVSLKEGAAAAAEIPTWARFLLKFDLDYRARRLNFLIEGQNRLYQLRDENRFPALGLEAINRLKRDFYTCLDTLRKCQDPKTFSPETRRLIAEVFPAPPSAADARSLQTLATTFVECHDEDLGRIIAHLADDIDLAASTRDVDLLLAAMDPSEWPTDARREVLVNYLGFPYWDILTLPVMVTRQAGEFREILVDRISPLDARTLSGLPEAQLKGTGFANFAGFLSRSYRENDYLLGRLHAIDRLIDIICDAAGLSLSSDRINIGAIKRRAFEAALDYEEPHLTQCRPLIAAVRRLIHSL